MQCPNCRVHIEDNSIFCPYCGGNTKSHQEQTNYSYNYSNATDINQNNSHQNQTNYNYNYSNTTDINQNNSHQNQTNYNYNYSNTTDINQNNSHQNQTNYSYNYSNQSQYNDPAYNYNYNKTVSSDEDYIKAYVGSEYNKIKDSKFSIFVFLFGADYLLYRKLYLYGFLYLFLAICFTIFVDGDYSSIFFIINIFLSYSFPKLYLKEVEKRVQKIKDQNSDKSSTELLEICRKKGGTNIAIPIIISIVTFVAVIALVAFTMVMSLNTSLESNTPSNNITDNAIGDLTYTIPDEFEAADYNSETYKTYKYTTNNYESCRFTVKKTSYITNYNSVDDYLSQNTYTSQTDIVSPITDKNINNFNWRYLEVTKSYKKEIIQGAKYNNAIYTISYDEDPDRDFCNEKYQKFIKSLKFTTGANTI